MGKSKEKNKIQVTPDFPEKDLIFGKLPWKIHKNPEIFL